MIIKMHGGKRMGNNQENVGKMQEKRAEIPKKELNNVAKEKIYQKILDLDRSVEVIEQYELYVFVYKNIIQKAKRLEGYKDSAVYQAKYEKKLEELQKAGREEIYQKALELKKNAKKAEDLQWIRKEVHRIPGYKDIDTIGEWCDSMQENMEKREKRNAWIRLFIIVLIVGIIIVAAKLLLL